MNKSKLPPPTTTLALIVIVTAIALGGCGGGTSDSQAAPVPQIPAGEESAETEPEPEAAPGTEQSTEARILFASAESTSRFLSRATFGARTNDIRLLTGSSASNWFLNELNKRPSYVSDRASTYYDRFEEGVFLPFSPNTMGFWSLSANAPDQLRLRMMYALSQIFVVSDFGGEFLTDFPTAMGYYLDVLTEHALGNYRELLQAITYTPAMGYYLTYLGNQPADAATGRMPDENYAREILQLFSIGLLELNSDGTARSDPQGRALETYTNADVTGLAKVFTGLDLQTPLTEENEDFERIALDIAAPMLMYEEHHSAQPKEFLGTRIPAGTVGTESISLALDTIMAHPNVGPFIGRQLIQRFTTSDPSRAYVAEVAGAFDSGRYVLPDNTAVGDGRKGDLTATIAAVLFSTEAQADSAVDSGIGGKPREPVLRFIQWARAFEVDADHPEFNPALIDTGGDEALAQHPFRSRSVFNFYRPGYVAPGTQSGAAGMTVPELQIINASSIPGYLNFISYFVFAVQSEGEGLGELREEYAEFGYVFDDDAALTSFVPTYERELDLASEPQALVAHLNLLLANGDLSVMTQSAIASVMEDIPVADAADENAWLRVTLAILMTMTAPEYLVQR